VPADLPLQRFVGSELNQIALGRFQTQLHFAGCGSIFIEGRWELHDPNGELVDRMQDHEARDCYRIHRVLDLPVARFEIETPASFTLRTELPTDNLRSKSTVRVVLRPPAGDAEPLHLSGLQAKALAVGKRD
jgi:hypothetical protein